jgi:hypothetical protein
MGHVANSPTHACSLYGSHSRDALFLRAVFSAVVALALDGSKSWRRVYRSLIDKYTRRDCVTPSHRPGLSGPWAGPVVASGAVVGEHGDGGRWWRCEVVGGAAALAGGGLMGVAAAGLGFRVVGVGLRRRG